MQNKAAVGSDVQLLAMMVAKVLRMHHHIDQAPEPHAYEVINADGQPNGSVKVQVAISLERGSNFILNRYWWADAEQDLEAILASATDLAADIASVHEDRLEIIAMTSDVRAAAAKQIAKEKRRGLPYRLISTNPCAIGERVRDGIAVDVIFERLSEALRPEQATFSADCAALVIEAFDKLRDEQTQRFERRLAFEKAGATGRIDSVVVNAMQEAGHDMAEVLKLLAATDDWIIDVGDRADEKRMFRLHWRGGDVYAQITLGNGSSWLQDRLTFPKAPFALADLEGQRVRDVVDDAIFGDIRIVSASGDEGEFGSLNCTRNLLYFDADTGKLWAA